MRFLEKLQGKTRMDKMRIETFRYQLKSKQTTLTKQKCQLRWLEHVQRLGKERMVKKT